MDGGDTREKSHEVILVSKLLLKREKETVKKDLLHHDIL
jgi:hypothetical protein